jgi:spermidine synthase
MTIEGTTRRADVQVTISEERGVRYLHFGSVWVQGAMRIRAPEALELDYTRQMMAWLLFLAPPARILQLGLGAGSLTKFTLAQLPDTLVTVCELSQAVIDGAHQHFRVPREHPRMTIVHADAEEFVAKVAEPGAYGVVQIDLYDQAARGPVLDSEAFYAGCRRLLAKAGLCVVNLFGEHASFPRNILRLEQVFDGRVLLMPPVNEGNVIALAFSGPRLSVAEERLSERATYLESTYGLKAGAWVDAIKRSGYVAEGRLVI